MDINRHPYVYKKKFSLILKGLLKTDKIFRYPQGLKARLGIPGAFIRKKAS
jgi:hypothetical protein